MDSFDRLGISRPSKMIAMKHWGIAKKEDLIQGGMNQLRSGREYVLVAHDYSANDKWLDMMAKEEAQDRLAVCLTDGTSGCRVEIVHANKTRNRLREGTYSPILTLNKHDCFFITKETLDNYLSNNTTTPQGDHMFYPHVVRVIDGFLGQVLQQEPAREFDKNTAPIVWQSKKPFVVKTDKDGKTITGESQAMEAAKERINTVARTMFAE